MFYKWRIARNLNCKSHSDNFFISPNFMRPTQQSKFNNQFIANNIKYNK